MTDKKKIYSIEITSDLSELARVEQFAEKAFRKAGVSDDEIDDLAIVFTEVVNNAIIHGNQKDKSKKVFIEIRIKNGNVEIRVKDQGNGFNPDTLADPLAPENLMKESGRGIFILKALMDEVDYEFSKKGTTIILKKKIEK